MSYRQGQYYFFEKSGGGFDFHPMKSWLHTSLFGLPTVTNHTDNIYDELKRVFMRIGWELGLVTDRIHLFKPGEQNSDPNSANTSNVPMPREEPEPLQTNEQTRVTVGFERYVRSELAAAYTTNTETDSKVDVKPIVEVVNETFYFGVTAEDTSGAVAVVEFNVELATSQVIANALCYMDALAISADKPVLGIMLARGFHKRIILAASTMSPLQVNRKSFEFSFEAFG